MTKCEAVQTITEDTAGAIENGSEPATAVVEMTAALFELWSGSDPYQVMANWIGGSYAVQPALAVEL